MENWDAISKKVYWDRNVALEKWREKVSLCHPSYLPDAVTIMTVAEFVTFFGHDKFWREWPTLRAALPAKAAQHAGVFDLAWSQIAGGGWNLKPTPDFFKMPPRQRQFLAEVARQPGRSIYAVAKTLNMQYRRAHDHSVHLVNLGKIRAAETIENGRRKTKLFPAYAVQSKPTQA